ncbi:MAG: hypothetical protein WCC08_09625, partial [Terrimicrobiaceae bacterium]
ARTNAFCFCRSGNRARQAAEKLKARGFGEREERIDFADLKRAEALQQGEIIDVRTTTEFQRGHAECERIASAERVAH